MTDYQAILQQLQHNLNILREREAKYAGNAPLDLLNQIEDHEQAITLTEQARAGDLSEAEWRETLEALLVSINKERIVIETGSVFDQRGQQVGTQYNAAGDIVIHPVSESKRLLFLTSLGVGLTIIVVLIFGADWISSGDGNESPVSSTTVPPLATPRPTATPFTEWQGKLAFSQDDEVFILDSDNPTPTALTKDGHFANSKETSPSWSPMGDRIVFVSTVNGNPDIFTINLDGQSFSQLTSNKDKDADPVWSPDGAAIAYVATHRGRDDLLVKNLETRRVTTLTANIKASNIRWPAWSPDGRHLAFESDFEQIPWPGTIPSWVTRQEPYQRRVYIIAATGDPAANEAIPIFDNPIPSGQYHPTWSPDCQQLAFEQYHGHATRTSVKKAHQINRFDLTKWELTGTFSAKHGDASKRNNIEPFWSEAGLILISNRLSGDTRPAIFMLDVEAGTMAQFPNTNYGQSPAFWTKPEHNSVENCDNLPMLAMR